MHEEEKVNQAASAAPTVNEDQQLAERLRTLLSDAFITGHAHGPSADYQVQLKFRTLKESQQCQTLIEALVHPEYRESFIRQGVLQPFAAASLAAPKDEAVHPEDYCHKCFRPNISWFVPNELWNKAVRAAGEPEILCPVCFVQLCEAAGISTVWKVAPRDHAAKPSGAARGAAVEIYKMFSVSGCESPEIQDQIAAIISKHMEKQ